MSDESAARPRGKRDPTSKLAAALTAFHSGEVGALDRLLLACHAQMENLARRMLGGHPEIRRGFGDTCDVTQQAWLRLAKALQAVRPDTPLHVMRLAYQQVRREIIDLARKYGGPRSPEQGRVSNVVVVKTRAIDLVNGAAAPSESFTSLDELSRFHDAVDRLPEELRDVFTMRWYLDARVMDVAKAVGCSPDTVKDRSAKAKALLQAALTSQ